MTAALTTHRPVPGRVPAFPDSGIPPFIYSVLPPVAPKWLLGPVLKRTIGLDKALWQEMVDGLWEGDEPMDRLIDWMFEFGPRPAKLMFDQALDHGIRTVKDAPAPLREFFALIDTLPAWVDMDEVDRGTRVMHACAETVPYVGRDLALMGGYLLSGFNEPLVMTGALNKGAGRRFAETFSWGMDIWTVGGMERFGVGFRGTIRVRMIHGLVRRNLQRKAEWDHERLAVPINQTDMMATVYSTVAFIMGSRVLGVPVTPREFDAAMHHTQYTGWLLGVKREWLTESSSEAMKLLLHASATQPRGEETSRIMAQSLADEPLSRHYPRFQKLRRRIDHSLHLSISRAYLSKRTLEQLGLPANHLPWYPALTVAPRLAWQLAHRLLPGGYERLVRRGEKKQRRMLKMFHEGAQSAMGILKPDESHPAHI